MKKTLFLALAMLSAALAMAQQNRFDKNDNLQSLADQLNIIKKKSDKLNLYLNFQGSFNAQDDADGKWGANFRVANLRLEMRGYLTDKLFYRLRHRLNKSNQANALDNLASATDMMYAGYHFNDKFTVILGKQAQAWGGFEYDLNPIFVYEFSDFGNNMDCFMTGATFSYTPNKEHEIAIQITNSRAKNYENVYQDFDISKIEQSKTPLTYILNWNGHLFDNLIKTRWSALAQTEAKGKYTYSLGLGTMLNLPKFQLAFDYMMDNSDIDRLGIASNELSAGGTVLENVTYNSFIAKAEYQPSKNWNLWLKGTYETASVEDSKIPPSLKDYRKSYGYLAGVEYLPFEDQGLRVFLTYLGKKVNYTENIADLNNYNKNRISLGIIYRIKAF